MLAKLSKYNISLKELVGSLLVTLLIISQCFFAICEFTVGTTLPYKILLVIGCVIAFFCFDKRFSFKQFTLFAVIFYFFACTYFMNNNSSLPDLISSFVIYGCSAFVFSFCKINEKCVFWSCVIFGYIWLALFILKNHLNITDTFSFGYTILPITICSFLLLTYESNWEVKKIPLIIIESILFSISFVLLALKGSRGPVLCFIIFLFIHFLPCLKKWKQAIIYLSIVTIFVVILINFEGIVEMVYHAIPGKISFIDKTYQLINSQRGITNSRFEIIAAIFKEYEFKNFIFGIGIGTYNSTHPVEGYTHNLFTSVLLDFGIIGFAFVVCIIVLFLFYIFEKTENRRYPELLITVSVVTLLFSGNYWKYFTFWLFVFFILNVSASLLVNDNKETKKKFLLFKRKKTC